MSEVTVFQLEPFFYGNTEGASSLSKFICLWEALEVVK